MSKGGSTLSCEKVIEIALNEVGYLEKETNKQLNDKKANAGYGNYTKYARDLDKINNFYNGKKNGYAWCDIFVDWCFVQVYGHEKAKEVLCQPDNSAGAGCSSSMQYYKDKKRFYKTAKIGDQIFFKRGQEIVHTGLVYKISETKVYTIEGNTSSASGVVANGGAVVKKSYDLTSTYIAGYGRPKYGKTITDEKQNSTTKLVVDGLWGKDTTVRAQQVFGTPVDGIISNQPLMYKVENPGLLSSTFEWKFVPNKKGSDLIKAIQKKVGVKQDGFIGPTTIKAMQKWLGTAVDGKVSKPSLMVKAFQKWLNSN